MILKLVLYTQMIWMIFMKILKNTIHDDMIADMLSSIDKPLPKEKN